jgi:nucleotide-binding universal stress UspA family protein
MRKVLIAVDDTKGSKNAVSMCTDVCKCMAGDVVLVYVEKFEGRSLMDESLGIAEMTTLREVLEGTEYKEKLDAKAEAVLDFYKNALAESGVKSVKPLVKYGHPAEEVLNTAKEEGADIIIVGSRGKRASHRFMGSVSREVANNAEVPVLIVK